MRQAGIKKKTQRHTDQEAEREGKGLRETATERHSERCLFLATSQLGVSSRPEEPSEDRCLVPGGVFTATPLLLACFLHVHGKHGLVPLFLLRETLKECFHFTGCRCLIDVHVIKSML